MILLLHFLGFSIVHDFSLPRGNNFHSLTNKIWGRDYRFPGFQLEHSVSKGWINLVMQLRDHNLKV